MLKLLDLLVKKEYKITDIQTSNLPKEHVARGAFGKVYKYCYNNDKHVAIKKIRFVESKKTISSSQKLFISEIAILTRLSHPNIIKIVGYVAPITPTNNYMVLEWISGCDLSDFIHITEPFRPSLREISMEKILNISLQIAKGLRYLHTNGVLHCDFKSNNIMYDYSKDIVKIVDFGLSCMSCPKHGCINMTMPLNLVAKGIPELHRVKYWHSPEQIRLATPNTVYTDKSDIFSFGIIMYELATGGYPYNCQEIVSEGVDKTVGRLLYNLCRKKVKFNKNVPDDFAKLLIGSMRVRPEKRLTSTNAVAFIQYMVASCAKNHELLMQNISTSISCEEVTPVNTHYYLISNKSNKLVENKHKYFFNEFALSKIPEGDVINRGVFRQRALGTSVCLTKIKQISNHARSNDIEEEKISKNEAITTNKNIYVATNMSLTSRFSRLVTSVKKKYEEDKSLSLTSRFFRLTAPAKSINKKPRNIKFTSRFRRQLNNFNNWVH